VKINTMKKITRKIDLLGEAIMVVIEIVMKYLNESPDTMHEDFCEKRSWINKLERIKREINNG